MDRLPLAQGKYARVEWERRFLLDHLPVEAEGVRARRIHDRYIEGTTLRLREDDCAGQAVCKLTQKLPEPGIDGKQGLVTTIYLSEDEFAVFARLPAQQLTKTRYSVPPFGIDVFEDSLRGLVLAEAEFDSAGASRQLTVPPYIRDEVSLDDRFSGGSLATASRKELALWLSEYGIELLPL